MERYVLNLKLEHKKRPLLSEFNAFMYDLEIVHDIIVLNSNEEYADVKLNINKFWRRNGRPLKEKHKIRIVSLQSHSPIAASLLISGGMLACMIMQTIIMIKNYRDQNKKEEIEDFKNQMTKEFRELFDKTQKRLEKNQIKAREVEITKNKEKHRGEGHSR